MFNEFTSSRETLQVCPVESAGIVFALPERDVIGVLPLDDEAALTQIAGVLAMNMDDRYRPLISLRQTLCQSAHPTENVVVVLRVGAQLFGVLVDQALEPTRADIHPTLEPTSALSTFSHIVRLSDGRDAPVLNPANLALSAQHPTPARELCLAA